MSDSARRRPALSPSRAQDFERCPLLYRLRVVDRLPEPPSSAAVRGTLVHSVLEGLFDLPAASRLPERAEAMLAPGWERMVASDPRLREMFADDAQFEAWFADAAALVRRYFTLEDPRRLEPAGRELLIEVQLPDGPLLRGFVDRLDVAPDGRIRVVDYKTGKAPRPQYQGGPLFQLRCYALAVWLERGVVPTMLQLIYLGSGDVLRFEPTAEELEATRRRLGALWDAVTQAAVSGTWPAVPGKLCPWCSFQAICPAFGGTPPPVPADAAARLGVQA